MTLEEQFFELFQGLERAHGSFKVTDTSKIKHGGKAQTLKEPYTIRLWKSHLDGDSGLGVVPINDQNECVFGAIDIDEYNLDHAKLVKKLVNLKLNLFPCRSKSGGMHVYLFSREWVPAALMRRKLQEIAVALGFGGSEIFPKQDAILASRGDIGSWINMPYFDRQETNRYAFGEDCSKLPSGRFVEVALEKRYAKNEFKAISVERSNDVNDGPPCLQFLCGSGFPEGTRNDGLFNVGVYLRKKCPDTWRTEIEGYNHKYFKPPLGIAEVKEIIKSVSKKDYTFTCSRPPIASHCNITECRTRRFGIGGDNALPRMHSLTKFDTEPPIWFLDVDGGGRLELNTDDLQVQKRFQRRCMDVLNMMPTKIKENEWAKLVNELLQECNIIEAPPDASVSGQLMEHVHNFLSQRAMGDKKEDLARGKAIRIEDTCYFRMADLVAYLDRHNFRDYKVNKITSIVKQNGAEHHFFNMEGKGVNCWKLNGVVVKSKPKSITETVDGKTPF
jgi:hypothetical protein